MWIKRHSFWKGRAHLPEFLISPVIRNWSRWFISYHPILVNIYQNIIQNCIFKKRNATDVYLCSYKNKQLRWLPSTLLKYGNVCCWRRSYDAVMPDACVKFINCCPYIIIDNFRMKPWHNSCIREIELVTSTNCK